MGHIFVLFIYFNAFLDATFSIFNHVRKFGEIFPSLFAVPFSFTIMLSKASFSTVFKYSVTLCNTSQCPSFSFPYSFFSSVPFSLFSFHFHFSHKCHLPGPDLALHSAKEFEAVYRKLGSQQSLATTSVMRWCSCCSTSTVLRPKFAAQASVGQVKTMMAFSDTQRTTTP